MIENRVKKVMRAGDLAIGTYVTLSDSQVVEIIGLAGFDAACSSRTRAYSRA